MWIAHLILLRTEKLGPAPGATAGPMLGVRWAVRAWTVLAIVCGASLIDRWVDDVSGETVDAPRALATESPAASAARGMTADDFRIMYEGTTTGGTAVGPYAVTFP